jgi:prevent-host-death family protein
MSEWPHNVAMAQFSLSEAKAQFSELVRRAMLGEEVIITRKNKPLVKIVAARLARRKPGTGKGIWMAPDFDELLADFRQYW